jgi:hypothetical protein
MIDPAKMQYRCLHVMHMNRVFYHIPSEVVSLAENSTRLDAASRHPPAKRPAKMIPTLGACGIPLSKRSTAKFSAPDHKGVIKHATVFQILDKRCRWPLGILALKLKSLAQARASSGIWDDLDQNYLDPLS